MISSEADALTRSMMFMLPISKVSLTFGYPASAYNSFFVMSVMFVMTY